MDVASIPTQRKLDKSNKTRRTTNSGKIPGGKERGEGLDKAGKSVLNQRKSRPRHHHHPHTKGNEGVKKTGDM